MQRKTKYAFFNFEKSDRDLIDVLAEHLNNNVEAIYDFFEIKPTEDKVVINIIPTKKEYDAIYRKIYGLNEDACVEDWCVGNCYNGVITYLSIHDYKNTAHSFKVANFADAMNYYKKTILHEYVHFVNEKFNKIHNCNHTERYLVEGIATYLSKQKENQKIPFNFTCEQVLNRERYLYGAYYLLTKYLVENYSKNEVLDVFKSNGKARDLLQNELYEKAKHHYNNPTSSKCLLRN